MKELIFIVNPNSGVNRKKLIEPALEKFLDPHIFTYKIAYTKHKGHATDLAKEAVENKSYAAVAVGGDGSVNEVATGLLGSATKLGILPLGSGNGLARTLKIPISLAGSLKKINTHQTKKIDVGFANGQPFLSNAGVAFDAKILKAFEGNTKRGLSEYIKVIGTEFLRYGGLQVQVDIDGKRFEEKVFIISIANGDQYGYNYKTTRKASCEDGLLDVVLVKKFPLWKAPLLAVETLSSDVGSSSMASHFTGKQIRLFNEHLCFFQYDGEITECHQSVEFSIEQGLLEVMV